MATKTLTITEDAYNLLSSRKGPNESFSDVISRITKSTSLRELVGILSDKDAKELKSNIAKTRKQMDKDFEKRMKRFK
ncbi:MAG: antitoxin VapB family protein [Nanoarchaeota archaeon]|nr:antitoxin VapB family protein [Nanoarchaeota archaeon]